MDDMLREAFMDNDKEWDEWEHRRMVNQRLRVVRIALVIIGVVLIGMVGYVAVR